MKKFGYFLTVTILLSFSQNSCPVLDYFGFGSETEEQKKLRLLKEQEIKELGIVAEWETLEGIFDECGDSYEKAVALWDAITPEFDNMGDDLESYQDVATYEFKEDDKELQDHWDKLVAIIKEEQAAERQSQEDAKSAPSLDGIKLDKPVKWITNEIKATQKAYIDRKDERKNQLAVDKKALKKQEGSDVNKLDFTESEKALVDLKAQVNQLQKRRVVIEAIKEHRKRYAYGKKDEKLALALPSALSVALLPVTIKYVDKVHDALGLLKKQWRDMSRVFITLSQLKDVKTGNYVFDEKVLLEFSKDYTAFKTNELRDNTAAVIDKRVRTDLMTNYKFLNRQNKFVALDPNQKSDVFYMSAMLKLRECNK